MKKFAFKITYELRLLWKLLIPLVLLLTIFYGIAISLINVSVDIPKSFYKDYDERVGYTSISANDVTQTDISKLLDIADSYSISSDGITKNITYTSKRPDGDIILNSNPPDDSHDFTYLTYYYGIGIDIRESSDKHNKEYINNLQKNSSWFTEGEYASTIISVQIAELLDVNIGDVFYIGEATSANLVRVIGTFDSNMIGGYTHVLLSSQFVLTRIVNTANIDMIIEEASNVMTALNVANSVSDNVFEGGSVYYLKSIQWITAGIVMLAVIIIIASILITYSVSKFILDKRENFINTARLLGGKTTDIISIYGIIIMMVETLAVFIGSFIAIGLSNYATTVSSDIFEVDITNNFDIYVPFVVLGCLAILTGFVIGMLYRRLNKGSIITRIRDGGA